MNEIESLLSRFQPNNNQSSPTMWGDVTGEQEESSSTPEDEDSERLEESIREVFSNKQLLNKSLATFLGVFAASGGVNLMTYLGIGAMATGTLSSIVLGLFFANALTKIRYDDQIHIDREFIVAAAQTTSVAASLWIAFDEYRAVSDASKTGKTLFYEEVKHYEIKSVAQTDLPWTLIGGSLLGLLAIAVFLKWRNS
ncbi:MAG: hypothetical protein HWQ38_36075 [Nostoc sp. NMS7]|uniref:hypothetical protein n=1 Tax=Nostoc sp. NMS7 TaxID=2815391 RepID=UPI0025CE4394|nr:hypothetical protein [Nostoc sp. NMS7]MBN3951602.1 hypothetical protein [Nostoc sp. NMS7]